MEISSCVIKSSFHCDNLYVFEHLPMETQSATRILFWKDLSSVLRKTVSISPKNRQVDNITDAQVSYNRKLLPLIGGEVKQL